MDGVFGQLLKFKQFMRQFYARTVSNTRDDEERLANLEQLTTREAHRIVRSYCQLSAYPTVMEELEVKYGDEDAITLEYIRQMP